MGVHCYNGNGNCSTFCRPCNPTASCMSAARCAGTYNFGGGRYGPAAAHCWRGSCTPYATCGQMKQYGSCGNFGPCKSYAADTDITWQPQGPYEKSESDDPCESESSGPCTPCSGQGLPCNQQTCAPCGPCGPCGFQSPCAPCRPCRPCGSCNNWPRACTQNTSCRSVAACSNCRPCRACCPHRPCAPCGPCSRAASCGPCRPCSRSASCGPAGHCGPCHPCGPCAPNGSCCPCASYDPRAPGGSCGPCEPRAPAPCCACGPSTSNPYSRCNPCAPRGSSACFGPCEKYSSCGSQGPCASPTPCGPFGPCGAPGPSPACGPNEPCGPCGPSSALGAAAIFAQLAANGYDPSGACASFMSGAQGARSCASSTSSIPRRTFRRVNYTEEYLAAIRRCVEPVKKLRVKRIIRKPKEVSTDLSKYKATGKGTTKSRTVKAKG